MLKEFDSRRKEFVKVFPYEYQRALKQKAAETPVVQPQPTEPKIQDIEDAAGDFGEQKKAERALDKIKGKLYVDFILPIFIVSLQVS